MSITVAAQERLQKLLNRTARSAAVAGLRLSGYVGTCRGSTPILKPVKSPQTGDLTIECQGISLFIDPTLSVVLNKATLDYDSSFMGRGLVLTWPHRDGCACQCH